MNILHIDSAITGEASVSRQLTAQIVAKLKAANPTASVTYRDLNEGAGSGLTPELQREQSESARTRTPPAAARNDAAPPPL